MKRDEKFCFTKFKIYQNINASFKIMIYNANNCLIVIKYINICIIFKFLKTKHCLFYEHVLIARF